MTFKYFDFNHVLNFKSSHTLVVYKSIVSRCFNCSASSLEGYLSTLSITRMDGDANLFQFIQFCVILIDFKS